MWTAELPRSCKIVGDPTFSLVDRCLCYSFLITTVIYALAFSTYTNQRLTNFWISPRADWTLDIDKDKHPVVDEQDEEYCQDPGNFSCHPWYSGIPTGCVPVRDGFHHRRVSEEAGQGFFIPTTYQLERTTRRSTPESECVTSCRREGSLCTCTSLEARFVPDHSIFGVMEYQPFMRVPNLDVMPEGVNAPICANFLKDDIVGHQICTSTMANLSQCLMKFGLSLMDCEVKLLPPNSSSTAPIPLTKNEWGMSMWGGMYVNISALLQKVRPLNEKSKINNANNPLDCSWRSGGAGFVLAHKITVREQNLSNPWTYPCHLGLPWYSRMVKEKTGFWPCFKLEITVIYNPLARRFEDAVAYTNLSTGEGVYTKSLEAGVKVLVRGEAGLLPRMDSATAIILGLVSALGVWNLRAWCLKQIINRFSGPRGKVYQKAMCQPITVNSILAHWFSRCTTAIQTYKQPGWQREKVEEEVSEVLQLIGMMQDRNLDAGKCAQFVRDLHQKCFLNVPQRYSNDPTYRAFGEKAEPGLEEWVQASDYGELSTKDVVDMVAFGASSVDEMMHPHQMHGISASPILEKMPTLTPRSFSSSSESSGTPSARSSTSSPRDARELALSWT